MRILVVCGAGASSTFVAQRLRHAAEVQGLAVDASAGTLAGIVDHLDSVDVVLLGPHLSEQKHAIEEDASGRGVRVILLPADIFGDLDGSRTLDLVLDNATASA